MVVSTRKEGHPSGTTRLFTMIGSPVTQVRSPGSFNRHFAEHGVDAVMVAVDVPPGRAVEHLRHFAAVGNYGGSVVTVPHKGAAVEGMDETTDRARALGAVNVVRAEGGRLIGDMVDGLGFLAALRARGFVVRGARVAILGGGGAGAAIAHALAGAGAARIVVREVRTERHPFLSRLLRDAAPDAEVGFDLVSLEDFDLAVNATPVGMKGDSEVPFPTDTLSAATLVADVVTDPAVTPWLAAALEKGCGVQYGAEMADGQFGWLGRHLGFGIPYPDREVAR